MAPFQDDAKDSMKVRSTDLSKLGQSQDVNIEPFKSGQSKERKKQDKLQVVGFKPKSQKPAYYSPEVQ